ncbi:DUF2089 domain-containing protein [Clostridium sp.]|uniref:DUF2089 domain-containing protein n=2 Tax=Clostridium sp. TaxID=1506 RepID=UPI003DAA126C
MVYKVINKCPVCGSKLLISKLKCSKCSTVIENDFEMSKFEYLTKEQLRFIEVFLKNRGNIKDVEKELGISYPTVRSKLDEVISALGYNVSQGSKVDKVKIVDMLDRGEITKILKMVEEGKITSDKAQELIQALNDENTDIQIVSDDDIMDKMLKIRVNSHDGDNVNVNLPVKFIKTILKTVGKIPISDSVKGMENIDLNLISEAIDNGLSGKIVDVKSANDDIVEVVIE